ncbi:MAG: CoA-binding protein [Chlorobi bacterium]|nr:CoA-binding protein [Chlorobiota bacterium]
MEKKRTVVLGASPNPERFSHKAVKLLKKFGHPVVAVGRRAGEIDGIPIIGFDNPPEGPVHTVTIYLAPDKQKAYYDYILNLHPRRVIFNPGTENPELEKILKEREVEIVRNCTLQMLRKGLF